MADPSPTRSSLTVLGGPLDGTRLVLDDLVDEILIGSDVDCRLALDLPGVSPIHARIWVDFAGVEVRDTRSPRGIYVNDDRITDRTLLRDGDILWLGPPGDETSVMIHCRIAPSPDAVAPSVAGAAPTVEEEVFVEDVGSQTLAFVAPPSPAQEYVEVAEDVLPPAAVENDFFVEEGPTVASAPPVDEFVVDFSAPGPAAVPEPVAVPAPPVDDAFFVEDGAPATFVDERPHVSEAGDAFFVDANPPAAPAGPLDPVGGFEEFAAPDLSDPLPPSTPAWSPAAPSAVPEMSAPIVAALPELVPVLPQAPPEVPAVPASKPPVAAGTVAEAARRPTTGPATSPRPSVRREAPAGAARPVPGRRAAAPSRTPLYVGLGVLALAVLGGGGYFAMRALGAPQLVAVTPARVHVGQVVVLAGKNFGSPAARNEVLIGGRPATVQAGTVTELRVEVPEVATAPGRDSRLPVLVRFGGRETAPGELAVYQTPRIHGISPSVALPGEDVTLAGAGWGAGAKAAFGSMPAEVLEVTPTSLRVKVPELTDPEGTAVPIVVTMGSDASNSAPFLVGKLPLITDVEPRTASVGDLVTIGGRGFEMEAGGNLVLIGGVHALLAVPQENQLKVVVPRVALGGGEVPVEVRVRGKEKAARSTITLSAAADPLDFRFIPEPFDEATDRQLAVLSTGLGPAFVVAASGNKTAAQRALDFASRLNAAAASLKASREATVEVRTLDDNPAIGLLGKPEVLVEVSAEDAAAYNDDWTRQGRGGTVTRERLARWWAAVLKDLVLLLVRGEKPQFAAGLSAPEAKVLADIFQAARRTGQFGVPRSVAEQAKNPYQTGLRLLALRVPASVPGSAAGSAAGAAPAVGAFKLEGVWSGVEMEGDRRKYVTVTFRGNGGTLAFEGTVSISMNLDRVDQPQKGTVRYTVQSGSSTRHYLGKWDGRRIAGKISSDASDKGDIGTFELSPR